jgi:hypothetical protein
MNAVCIALKITTYMPRTVELCKTVQQLIGYLIKSIKPYEDNWQNFLLVRTCDINVAPAAEKFAIVYRPPTQRNYKEI